SSDDLYRILASGQPEAKGASDPKPIQSATPTYMGGRVGVVGRVGPPWRRLGLLRSHWPQGTSTGRTSTASMMMPTTRAKPSWRIDPSGLVRNEAKLEAVMAAAELIRPPVWATARVIPERRPSDLTSSCIRLIRKTL